MESTANVFRSYTNVQHWERPTRNVKSPRPKDILQQSYVHFTRQLNRGIRKRLPLNDHNCRGAKMNSLLRDNVSKHCYGNDLLDKNRNIVTSLWLNIGAASASQLPGFDRELHAGVPDDLFVLTNCKLCRVSMNAPSQAQQHYTGKCHSKRVKQYVEREKSISVAKQVATNENNDGPTAPTVAEMNVTNSLGVSRPSALAAVGACSAAPRLDVYCNLCDVSFNSDKQAEQHYHGKNHARRQKISQLNMTAVKVEPATEGRKAMYMCTVCGVCATSLGQLTSHLRGTKHMTKLRVFAQCGRSSPPRRSGGHTPQRSPHDKSGHINTALQCGQAGINAASDTRPDSDHHHPTLTVPAHDVYRNNSADRRRLAAPQTTHDVMVTSAPFALDVSSRTNAGSPNGAVRAP